MKKHRMTGKDLRLLRSSKGYTQTEWGARLGLSQSVVSELEQSDEYVDEALVQRAAGIEPNPQNPERKQRRSRKNLREQAAPDEHVKSHEAKAESPEAKASPPTAPAPLHPKVEDALSAFTRLATLVEELVAQRTRPRSTPKENGFLPEPEGAPGDEAKGHPATVQEVSPPPEGPARSLPPSQPPASQPTQAASNGSPPPRHPPERSGVPFTWPGVLAVNFLLLVILLSGFALFLKNGMREEIRAELAKREPPLVRAEPPVTVAHESQDGGLPGAADAGRDEEIWTPPDVTPGIADGGQPVEARKTHVRPVKGQKLAPCDPDKEYDLDGSCWWKQEFSPPCRGALEHDGMCFVPAPEVRPQKKPVSNDPQ